MDFRGRCTPQDYVVVERQISWDGGGEVALLVVFLVSGDDIPYIWGGVALIASYFSFMRVRFMDSLMAVRLLSISFPSMKVNFPVASLSLSKPPRAST